jgi:Na+-driven multidrug efflux pump
MVYLIIVAIIYYVFRNELVGFFSADERVISIGAEWLGIISYSYFVYGWWMVSVQAFNGAGDTKTPTLINLVFFWAIQIPLCYILAITFNWAESGVFWGVFFSETSVGLFTLWLFSKGKWKQAVV